MTPTRPQIESWLRPPLIVKVGGSLFDWPELKTRLPQFLATLKGKSIVLVPGGGKTADVIRDLDRAHALGDEAAHWLALRALTLNAHFLAELLGGVRVVEGLNASRSAWRRGGMTIIDPFRFARGDESRPDYPPHIWSVTSDSIAARIAHVAEAEKLVLLKSTTIAAGLAWLEAAQQGHVDEHFPSLATTANFVIEAINLRKWTPAG